MVRSLVWQHQSSMEEVSLAASSAAPWQSIVLAAPEAAYRLDSTLSLVNRKCRTLSFTSVFPA